MKRFAEEVKIMRRLKLWHFVEFFGSYTDSSCLGLFMSPVADTDLAKYLKSVSSADSRSANLD